ASAALPVSRASVRANGRTVCRKRCMTVSFGERLWCETHCPALASASPSGRGGRDPTTVPEKNWHGRPSTTIIQKQFSRGSTTQARGKHAHDRSTHHRLSAALSGPPPTRGWLRPQ